MTDRIEITVQGRVGSEPTRRVTANGASWVTFRLGSTPRIPDRATGEYRDDRTGWFTVKVWRQLAENVAESVHKGTPVIVRGKVYVDTWTAESGERWDHVINADAVAVDLAGGTARFVRTVREAAAPPAALTGPDGSRWETTEAPEEPADEEAREEVDEAELATLAAGT
ncbi:single-stranded DNA-binding protein [Georgenia ruanii]|uniref:Single-stranded DNA-binding protein n=1 Tax=Georgenia ruanii TaxID=348442 RepID=A0A7J9URJ4_9MICO|nr:single-stranded DNA-binding protein [Georgenia ruanii]MPV87236.1 single-stranded DNA-binding protein [Georgenia ruanii]